MNDLTQLYNGYLVMRKHIYWLLLTLVSGWHTTTLAQVSNSDKEWRAISLANHQKGQWLIGAGGTLFGATAKAGKFVANRTWVGLSGEATAWSETRIEAGAFARYYLWAGGFVSGFTEAGVTYGRFREIQDSDDVGPARFSSSPKLTVGVGLELPVYRRLSLEGSVRVGRLTEVNWVQPSCQGSLTIYFAR